MAEAPYVVLEIRVPRRIYELLEEAEAKLGVRKEDLVARGILKVLEEAGVAR